MELIIRSQRRPRQRRRAELRQSVWLSSICRMAPGSPASAGDPARLGDLREQLEVGDEPLVALDRVILVAALVLLLDEQQVGVAGLEDPQVAARNVDLGELRRDRRRVEAVAGVDQFGQTL